MKNTQKKNQSTGTPKLSGKGYSSSFTVKVSIATDDMHGSSAAACIISKIDEFSFIEISWFGHPFSEIQMNK